MITVKLFAYFRDGRGKEKTFDLADFPNPGAICDELGIERDRVAILLVNGFHQDMDFPLKEGDQVNLYPPVAGG